MTNAPIEDVISREYSAGFVTAIESDTFPPGLSEEIIAAIGRDSHPRDLEPVAPVQRPQP